MHTFLHKNPKLLKHVIHRTLISSPKIKSNLAILLHLDKALGSCGQQKWLMIRKATIHLSSVIINMECSDNIRNRQIPTIFFNNNFRDLKDINDFNTRNKQTYIRVYCLPPSHLTLNGQHNYSLKRVSLITSW